MPSISQLYFMKKIFTLLLLVLSFCSLNAQNRSERAVLIFEPHQLNQAQFNLDDKITYKASCLGDIPLENIEPFLAYSIVWYANDWQEENELKAIFHDGVSQLDPVQIKKDDHATPQGGKYFSQLYFTEKTVKKIRLQYSGRSEIEGIEVHLYSPGKTEYPLHVVSPLSDRACPCPQPSYVDRLGWCPDGTCPEDATPAFTTVTHLIVHHSAGSNTSSDWAATVRSIYDFHVFERNWDDIGYNWLIDPNGIIYQGRGDNVRGAHFCGTNAGTMGVCMLGDYTDVLPTAEAIGSLESLLAWKVCDVGIEANDHAFHNSSELELEHISGHRDGCSTACPGDSFYPMLHSVREAVQFSLDHECNNLFIAPPTNLDGTFNMDDNIQLTWEDNADSEDGYQLERSAFLNNDFDVIANLPANSTDYVDESFDPSTPYYYKVKATLVDSSSSYSNKFFIEPLTNSTSLFNENTVQVFPNPTKNNAQILIENDFIGNIEVSVFDALSRVVFNEYNINKNSRSFNFDLNFESFPCGIYWVRLFNSDQSFTTRVYKN